MQSRTLKTILKAAVLAAAAFLLTAGASFAQSVNLTAAPTSVTLPDGQVVPMWGYTCTPLAPGVTSTATCAALNANAAAGTWSPVVITVPFLSTGTSLTISLTNNLPAAVPATSLMIVGQLGGGLGSAPTRTPSPLHPAQGATWPIAGAPDTSGQTGGDPTSAGNPTFNPPPQSDRVRSFGTEVAAGATTALTWLDLKPGTYLIESGTHPSIQGPMGLYGILVVTTAPASATAAGTAYPAVGTVPAVTYNAEIPLLLSEIDPVQNIAVNTAVNTAGFSETAVWSGQPNQCGNPSSLNYHTCYPPAVNYDPRYYLINGVGFDRTHASFSAFATTPPTVTGTGTVLVRFVNAGLRMHVPSIVGALTGSPAASGFSLIAEDGNVLPGTPRVQSEVFLPAGKAFDVMINAPAAGTDLPVFDRQLSLSTNNQRDGGMQAYINVNGGSVPSSTAPLTAATGETYYCNAGVTLTVADPSKGVLANDLNANGAALGVVNLVGGPTSLAFNSNGTFTYTQPPTNTTCGGSFTYLVNGTLTATATITWCDKGSGCSVLGGAPTAVADSYTSNIASKLQIGAPGVLANDTDPQGHPLCASPTAATSCPTTGQTIAGTGGTVTLNPDGSFMAIPSTPPTGSTPAQVTFQYYAMNSQHMSSAAPAMVTVTFNGGSNLTVSVLDGTDKKTAITDYRWIIEEDRTFHVNPACTTNPPPAGCPTFGSGLVPTFGTNFHTSYMPVVAAGCTGPLSCESGQTMYDPTTGTHVSAVCDIGNGVCRPGPQQTAVDPSQVHLDPTKHYYLSVLPGDAATPFMTGNAQGGHGMGGAPVACIPVSPLVTCTSSGTFPAITVLAQPTPFPPSKLSVFVFEDDFPLNGEQDGGGGIDVLSPNEPGLGNFNITLFDDAGGTGDATGQMTYDMFNEPLSNSLAGTPDPSNNGIDACPISKISRIGTLQDANGNPITDPITHKPALDPTQTGITGTIVTCPKYEADGKTLSPLAGQAVIANLMPGRYGVVATPAADRIARGEEWLQTNTLDGQKAHDSFLRIGEPSFFQEFGPAGYHVSVGFANPKIINSRLGGVCNGSDPNVTGKNCGNTVTGTVTTSRMSRTPDERLYSSGDNSSFAFTQCYVSFGDPDGEDFAFTKCDSNGNFTLSGLPDGDWRITVFDQWNDMLVDGLSTPVRLGSTTPPFCPGAGSTATSCNMGQIATNQWQANIYTKTFLDLDGNGIQNGSEPGLTLVSTNIRFRDGSYSNFNNTDLSGNAGFNEIFPLFSWYVVETYSTRYKNTGTHVVYDAGGPADGTCTSTTAPCGASGIGNLMANTAEQVPLPTNLRVPGAYYCTTADCTDAPTPLSPGGQGGSTGRIDPAWVVSEGWQGFSGQNSFIEFGKKPFISGETGGIQGEVIYASTRPFDDPALLIHTSWTPDVPGVTINLYQEGTAPDGSQSLTLVDTTKTSSWDDWAQGFRSDGVPNMNCPGQGRSTGTAADLFFFTLFDQPMWLDLYNNGGTPAHTIPNDSQFKCYDGMHNWNQVQPVPYDGMYQFPSIIGRNPQTGAPTGSGSTNGVAGSRPGSNCTICVANPTDGTPMLPAGKYVVEMVVPPGYELVKEEDKNILIGDNYIAPVTQQFGGLGSIFILPDQAEVHGQYNANNAQNPTQNLGSTPRHEGDTGSVETFWPCVGASRIVPDYISLFPQSTEVAPFAGATRNLCDRKEVTLEEQTSALAKFWVFSSAHVAAHFTGVITDDFTSEFDPFSPQFGEKFSPANLPVSIKDWTGTEISRVYTDQWGTYNGLTYSTWEVNPPNPTGYAPTMMVTCMNDPGTGAAPDPLFNPAYSQFCYEIPFMPGQTQYMDTPVTPTSAFAGAGYNNVDCAYPALTPAIKEVDGDGIGPWVSAAGGTITITALGDQFVNNNAYSGPAATTPPYNQKTVLRHYGFGNGGTVALVGSDGVSHPLTGVTWSDLTITGTVPPDVPNCGIQQQAQYGGSNAQCGQLVITRADNGLQSIDTVTVTIGGKPPAHVLASGSIQSAIDTAAPGDLIIVDPTCSTPTGPVTCTTAGATTQTASAHNELLLMWKPVRLQGVGAASSILNANTHPAGKVDVWRREVLCLFGMALNGTPRSTSNPYDSTGAFSCPGTGWNYFTPTDINPQVDRLPTEATVGWDATLNGNLAEMLQEPSLMGALEGAGITVLAKGVNFPSNPWVTIGGTFPTGTPLLTDSTSGPNGCGPNTATATNPFPSNFHCNPSRIDGLGITNSSQGGGGIFVHAWGHNLEIANNRVVNNSGTLSGGINVGQGEFPPSYLQGAANADPGSCQGSTILNAQLPYCHNVHVNVHHNEISLNASTGDELFSATPAGAGGISFCTGSDYYKFNYNWVCGNLSTGDGGGFGHLGLSFNGDIEHNTILFNQSANPTIATNGGGILIMGTPDVDPPCGTTTDADCVPADLSTISPSDGVGPGLVINANLIMGNAAESGSGGGMRLQNINGSEVVAFPMNPENWYHLTVTNNIIANNVAGWDGAGISLIDALDTDIINNTIMSNDTTASSGVLYRTLQAPLASSAGTDCIQVPGGGSRSCPQPAGLVSIQTSAVLAANLPRVITCPAGHGNGGTGPGGLNNGRCRRYSVPLLENNVFWQNRAFYIGVGGLGAGTLNQQNVVTLFNAFTTTRAASQPITGACVTGSRFWDIGVRGDTSPTNHNGGTLNPAWSVLTSLSGGYGGNNNTSLNPTAVSQYCNGSRVPPELGAMGYQVPPGISDATVPNPIFHLTPAATVDEGNNWINISWGPLTMTNPVSGAQLGNYALASSSPAVDYVACASVTASGCQAAGEIVPAPTTDFYGNPRPDPAVPGRIDVGAIEYQHASTAPVPPTLTSITPSSGLRGTVVAVVLNGTNLIATTAVTVTPAAGIGVTITSVNSNTVTANFTIAVGAATTARNVTVTTPAGISNSVTFTVQGPTLTSITPTSGVRGTAVPVTITGTHLNGATAVSAGGAGVTIAASSIAVNAAGTSLTATFTIASNAAITTRNVTVTTPSGTTPVNAAVTFTVQGPTTASIAPTSGFRGTAVPVTITGTHLNGATAVSAGGAGVTIAASSITVNAAGTSLTATFTIASNATISTRNVTVTTPIGTTPVNAAVTFRVQGPTTASITPTSATHPASGTINVAVTITGSDLTGATAVNTGGGGVSASAITVNSAGTSLTATFTVSSTATRTTRNVTVNTPNGTTPANAAVTFTVN